MSDSLKLNPKVILSKNEISFGMCSRHGCWYSGEIECPDCFAYNQLTWWKKLLRSFV